MLELLLAKDGEAEPGRLAAALRFCEDVLFCERGLLVQLGVLCACLGAGGCVVLLLMVYLEIWPDLDQLPEADFLELLHRHLNSRWRPARLRERDIAEFEAELRRRGLDGPDAA